MLIFYLPTTTITTSTTTQQHFTLPLFCLPTTTTTTVKATTTTQQHFTLTFFLASVRPVSLFYLPLYLPAVFIIAPVMQKLAAVSKTTVASLFVVFTDIGLIVPSHSRS